MKASRVRLKSGVVIDVCLEMESAILTMHSSDSAVMFQAKLDKNEVARLCASLSKEPQSDSHQHTQAATSQPPA